MGEFIGEFDRTTLAARGTSDNLEALAHACYAISYNVPPHQFARHYGEDSGIVQLMYPGPVIEYSRVNGHFEHDIYQNHGNRDVLRRLLEKLSRSMEITKVKKSS